MNDSAFITCLCVLSGLLAGGSVYLIAASIMSIVGSIATIRRRQLDIAERSLDLANVGGHVGLMNVLTAVESALK